jgi:hypothetical protein
MAEQSALDRYAAARGDRDRVRESLTRTADLLERISRELRKQPITLPVEGIGEWSRVRTERFILKRDAWPDFDRLKTLFENAQEADQKEEQAWQQVPPEHQRVMNRG